MTAPIVRSSSRLTYSTGDLAEYAALIDVSPGLGDVFAEAMASHRAVQGQLWERVAEQKPTLKLRRTAGYRRVRAGWKERTFAQHYGAGFAAIAGSQPSLPPKGPRP